VLLREDRERGRQRRRPESRKGEDSGAEAEEQGERGWRERGMRLGFGERGGGIRCVINDGE
jgi:hypothetical protein